MRTDAGPCYGPGCDHVSHGGRPDPLTERERLLLAAVRQVLDPPWAARGHQFGRRDAVLDRAYRLLGATDVIDEQTTITSLMKSLERLAASPLGYEPECPPHSGHTDG